jgi:hypothetical protein
LVASPSERRRLYQALQLRATVDRDGTIRLSGIFDPDVYLPGVMEGWPRDPSEPVPEAPEETRVLVAASDTPSSSTVRTENILKVRFSATVGQEPEVEVTLI